MNDFYEYASVSGVGEMAGWEHHKSIDTSKKILQSFMNEKTVFAIVHKQDKKVIGSLGLHAYWANKYDKYKHLKVKEIGYVLSKTYWGQGLMPEAVKAVIDYCFTNLDIEAFTCGHFKENNQSRRVIEKGGFTFVKESEYYAKQLYSAKFGYPAIHSTIGVFEIVNMQKAIEFIFGQNIFGKAKIIALEVYTYPMDLIKRFEMETKK